MSQVGSVYRFDEIGFIWVSCGMSETKPEQQETPKKTLSPAAKRALAATRYGDWERGGIAYDF